MEAVGAVKGFLEYIVAGLIRHPEEVQVRHELAGEKHLFRVLLHPDDLGRVIGKGGKTISAIRSLAIAAAQCQSIRIEVELEEAA